MIRSTVGLVFVSLMVTLAACGGFSAEESKIKCDLERTANTTCFTDATYEQCLNCYETCGDDCVVGESCPSQYICSE
jgi:hypothetical protein